MNVASTPNALRQKMTMTGTRNLPAIVSALGVTQIFAWGTSYYLPAVLAAPITREMGWSISSVVGGLSLGLLAAGLVSPWVGRIIAERGGRPVLAVSACLLAVGLGMLASAQSLPLYLLAWVVIGLGMGAGLYDPAFATLGKLYGQRGRGAITTLTLFGGFASTVCWPLSAFLESHYGWRDTCLIYAGLQLVFALPIYLFVLPRENVAPQEMPNRPASQTEKPISATESYWGLFALLAVTITLASMISTAMSVHLLTVLQAKGLSLAEAVSLGTLVGPCQVAARTIEMVIARYHHPIWTKIVATSSVTVGLAALWLGGPVVTLAIVFYGAGIGLESIARGTLPLALFGSARYPVIMGRIAMPSLIAQAAAPSIGALLLDAGGEGCTLSVFIGAALLNVMLVVALFMLMRSRSVSASSLA
jgi:MFS family permease